MYQPALRPKNRHFRTLRTIGALILREMSTTYGKSVMGYLWALVEPIAALTLMSVVFSSVSAPASPWNQLSAVLCVGLFDLSDLRRGRQQSGHLNPVLAPACWNSRR